MNFYHAHYKKQYYNNNEGLWRNTSYNNQGIIVIANSYEEAKEKIEKCLTQVEVGRYRAVLVSDVVECIGLDRRYGFEDSFSVIPIFDK